MSPRLQFWFAWSIVPFVVIYLVAFGAVAHFLPPQSPGLSGAALVAFYQAHRAGIQWGQLIGLLASGLVLVWPAAISAQMARIEGGSLPMLAVMQYVSAALLALLFMLCSLIWTVAAYRPDISPEMLRMLSDAGWLIFVMAVPEYVVQMVSIGLVGLMDRRAEVFLPRWACYATFAEAVIGCGGMFATFYQSGPLAWDGLIGFWIPIASFVIWLFFVMLPNLLRAIGRDARGEV